MPLEGFAIAIGRCRGCGGLFQFHPERVPSYDGEPLCRLCVAWINRQRVAAGMEPVAVLPGAFGPGTDASRPLKPEPE